MPSPPPVVRNLVLCEDVIVDPKNRQRSTIVNVLAGIRSRTEPAFPYRQEKLGVYVQLTECRTGGKVRLDVLEADTDKVIFTTPEQNVTLPNNPLAVHSMRFRLRNCTFPAPGLYMVQFVFDNRVLSQQSLLLS